SRECPQGFGQAVTGCRRAALVTYHAQALARRHQLQHGVEEIVALGAVEPGGAHDGTARGREFQQGLLTGQFAGTIYTKWRRLRIRRIGLRGPAVEDEVSGDVYEAHRGSSDKGEVAHTDIVDGPGLLRITLRLVHLGVGGAVDDHVRCGFVQHPAQELHVANVA